MILYITSERFKGMLSDMAMQEDWELEQIAVEECSLQQILNEKMQIVSEMQCLVIEHSIITDTDKELEEGLDIAQSLWEGLKIILLEEELRDDEGAIQEVTEYENITLLNKNGDHLMENMVCNIKGKSINALEDESVWVGIVSSHSGAGVTHTAFNLVKFLSGVSDSVCYVEANESGDLSAMSEFYGMEKMEDNHYWKDGVDYWHQSIDQEKKYIVLDLGKYTSSKLKLLQHCRIKIVISDGKPYRIQDTKTVMDYINDDNTKLWLNYADPSDQDDIISKYFRDYSISPEFIKWIPGLYNGRDPIYSKVMKDYIHTGQDDGRERTKQGVFKGLLSKNYKLVRVNDSDQTKTVSKEMMPEQEKEKNENVFELLEQADRKEEQQEKIQEEKLQAQLQDEDTEYSSIESNEKPELSKKNKKRNDKAGKVIAMLMLICTAVLGGWYAAPYIQTVDFTSILNGQNDQTVQTVQTATKKPEVFDERLNIDPEIKISVMEVEGADGYEVSYSKDESFDDRTTVIVEVEKADKAVESLDAGQTYYVRVRAFKFDKDGTKIYGEYTDIQEIHT